MLQFIDVYVLENKLACVYVVVFPMVEGLELGVGEDDFDHFEVHDAQNRPNVPTFSHALTVVFGDFSGNAIATTQNEVFLNQLVDRCVLQRIAHRDIKTRISLWNTIQDGNQQVLVGEDNGLLLVICFLKFGLQGFGL